MGIAAYFWNLQQWNAKVKAMWSVPPAALVKPARDLMPAEARELVAFLVMSGEVSIAQTIQFDPAGRIVGPPPTQHIDINRPDIGGVTFLMPNGRPWHAMHNIQMAFLVVLWKLAVHLKVSHGATAIFAGGLGTGDDSKPNDCHHHGHCIDFWGIRKADGTELKVKADWGRKSLSVPMER